MLFAIFWGRKRGTQATISDPTQSALLASSVPTSAVRVANFPSVPSAIIPLPKVKPTTIKAEDRSPESFSQSIESGNVPIEFYGKVIDQDSNPVVGVKIQAGVCHWYSVNPVPFGAEGRTISIEKETIADGRFEINGVTGDGLGIGIIKNGYILSPKAPNSFGPNSGNFENPIIIKMWKEGIKDHLVSGSHVFGIDSGKVYTLDLINGKKIEGDAVGDLQITITRPSNAKPRENYPWSFSIKVIGGGFVETDPSDEFMYLAPETGYQPEIKMQFKPDNSDWTGVIKKQVYFRSRNGQNYGRAQIEIDAIYNVHSAIQIDYAVNPNSSRNLQP